jgi:NAD(P)-dependent dehydrogenase (short-subunit alcohol dehydrogenase family)
LSAGRTAVVTGAASGIGAAVVRRLVADGVRVVAVDRDASGLAAVASLGAESLVADLAEPGDCARVVDAGDGADWLVNAAGIISLRPIAEFTREDWRRIFSVNAEAVFFLCQAIGPRLRPGGAIVNLSSSSAKWSPTPEAAVYAASKAAVLSVTRSFAAAYAKIPIRVNAVLPGITDTPMQDKVLEEVAAIRGITVAELEAGRLDAVPLGRTSSPDECAGLIAFLLSDEAAYMTGQSVNFTGGMLVF